MSKNTSNYIVFDFETGGLFCDKHSACEIALIALDGESLKEIGRYESLIKPYGLDYDKEAVAIHGLTEEKLEQEGKSLKQVVKEVFAFIKENGGSSRSKLKKPILVGHNVIFDITFLQQIFYLENMDMSKILKGGRDVQGLFIPSHEDTFDLARRLIPGESRYNLVAVCELLGIEYYDAHRAMPDVEVTCKVLEQLYSSNTLSQNNEDINKQQEIFRKKFKI